MATAWPALRMHGVRKTFGSAVALDGVDLEARAGEVHTLIGENGAGKSTLMKVLSGAIAPDAGTMELDGEPFAPSGPVAALERGIAMIYQELNLAPDLTVEENVMLGREPACWGWVRRGERRQRVEKALGFLGHPEIAPDRRVAELGPGARQLVEIARALAGEVRVLVLDEPTSSLSKGDTDRLFEVIRRLAAGGVAVVYISHFLEEVQRIGERYTVLRDGRTAASGALAETTSAELIERMVGRELAEVYPHVPHEAGTVVLSLEALAGQRLPIEAGLELRRGEVLGIAGLIGAGRTELLRAVFGLDPVRAGTVIVAGISGRARTPARSLAEGVGLLSEDRKEEGLAAGLSVATNTTLSRLAALARAGWVRRRAQHDATRVWIERLDIRCDGPEQPVDALSGGNQQKVALARLLHHDVDVLLLDEPTRGVDVGSKVEVYRRIGELAAQGKAVLMVSSYLPELLGVCDRIAVMHRGRLSAARPAGEWTESALLAAATGEDA